MSGELETPRGAPWLHAFGAAVFFAPFCLFVLLRLDPALIYHRFTSGMHLADWRRLRGDLALVHFATAPQSMLDVPLASLLARPGGAIEAASAWLAEWFAFGWIGALAITLTALAACEAFGSLIVALGGRRENPVRLLPAVALLVLAIQYDNPLVLGLGLLAALAAAAAYARLRDRSLPVRVAAFVVLSAAVFWVALE